MTLDLIELVGRFADLRVCVVGEAMLDTYVTGTTTRLTREAPAPVVDVVSCVDAPGGAANTAANVAALGATPTLVSAVGTDTEGERLLRSMRQRGVATRHVQRMQGRSTLTKLRVIAGPQMLARVDSGDTSALDEATSARLAADLDGQLAASDVVIVSDYGYGVLAAPILDVLRRWREATSRILVVDAREPARYHDLRPTLVKPNHIEALRLLGRPESPSVSDRVEPIASEGPRLCELTGARIVAVTLDTEGAVVIEDDGTIYRTYAEPAPHSRAAGAGDTFTAAFALSLAAGAEPGAAAEVASAASRLVVRREGTTTCSIDDLRAILVQGDKIVDRQVARAIVRAFRQEGRRIVFTNGCFDIVHRGHVSYLSQAKALGDLLVLGLNSDASVRRLKGDGRPVNTLEDRAHVMAGLSAVDLIVPFEEDRPDELIRALQPDIVAKGGDYSRATLPELALVESLGGELRLLPFVEAQSTTMLIERISGRAAASAADGATTPRGRARGAASRRRVAPSGASEAGIGNRG